MSYKLRYQRTFVLLILISICRAQENSGAVVVNPSDLWDGVDGPWSSFQVELGSPVPQTVRVFPGFKATSIYAVLPEGCKNFDTDCRQSRGGFFETNASSTWDGLGIYSLNIGRSLGITSDTVLLGLDHVSFGIDVSRQLVATFTTPALWLGFFGLSFSNVSLSNSAGPELSFLERLRRNGNVTSRTWSYTAGAHYKKSHGSLILGGYDSFRFYGNSTLNVKTSDDIERTTSVLVKSIISSNSRQLSSTTFTVSFLPEFAYMWLPQQVCDDFSATFGLDWNSTSELYTISEEVHEKNRASNISTIFQLCNPEDATLCTEIKFPYAAFALNATYPLVSKNYSQRYFPIKPGNETAGYALGRAFLQEAHIFMDEDNGWFNISQARFDVGSQQVITVSHPLDKTSSISTESNNSSDPSGALTRGSIIGISIGSVAALVLVLGVWMLISWWRKFWPFKSPAVSRPPEQFAKAELDGSGRPWVELSEVERLEMQAHEPPKELPDGSQTAELPGITPIYELPASNSEPR